MNVLEFLAINYPGCLMAALLLIGAIGAGGVIAEMIREDIE